MGELLKLLTNIFIYGIISGAILGILNLISILFNNKYYIRLIKDILFCLITATLFLIAINIFNNGEIRLYLVFVFIFGLLLERKTIGKMFDKFYKFIYNVIVKIYNKFKLTKVYNKIVK